MKFVENCRKIINISSVHHLTNRTQARKKKRKKRSLIFIIASRLQLCKKFITGKIITVENLCLPSYVSYAQVFMPHRRK